MRLLVNKVKLKKNFCLNFNEIKELKDNNSIFVVPINLRQN